MDSHAIFSMMNGIVSQGVTGPAMIMGALLLFIGVLRVWTEL